MLCVFFHPSSLLSLQDALASFDFLKRNSLSLRPDLDGVVEQERQHPDLELSIHKDAEIRWEGHKLHLLKALSIFFIEETLGCDKQFFLAPCCHIFCCWHLISDFHAVML